VFEEYRRCTQNLFYTQEKHAGKYPQLSWKHRDTSGTLWWCHAVLEQLRIRNGRLNRDQKGKVLA